MPLSEEEQRLLEQMEHALAAEDPSFASALRGSKLRARNKRNAVLSVVGFIAGIGLLMLGVIVTMTFVGVAGFVLMLISAYVFLTAWRSRLDGADEEAPPPPRSSSGGASASSASFMHRMEERWKRRRDSDI